MEYYCLGENQASETFFSKFIRGLYLKRQDYRYYQEKNQVGLTSSSYEIESDNEIVDKIVK